MHTQDQYIFIHDAILESVTCGDTQIASSDLRRAIQQMADKGFAHQFAVRPSFLSLPPSSSLSHISESCNMSVCAGAGAGESKTR